jgi:hypothetical protein
MCYLVVNRYIEAKETIALWKVQLAQSGAPPPEWLRLSSANPTVSSANPTADGTTSQLQRSDKLVEMAYDLREDYTGFA